MTQRDQDLMKRYIYQVVRRLPRDQRDEVGLEIQELISDMLEQSGSMEDVLAQLGDPAKFAESYREDGHYLIGPEYFDTYKWFVKTVMICVIISVAAVGVIESLREGLNGGGAESIAAAVRVVINGITNTTANLTISGIGAFGGVTLIFAVMERQKIKIELQKAKEWTVGELDSSSQTVRKGWTPEALSPVPDKKAVISRSDSIAGIVFIVIFFVLIITAPHFFAAVLKEGEGYVTVPVFNLEKWNVILPFFAVSLLVGLVDEILRLIAGVYCRMVMISNIVCGTIMIVLNVVILKALPLWNPDFAQQIQNHAQFQGKERFIEKVAQVWDTGIITNGFLILIIACTLLEIAVTVYKTLRYGMEKS